MRGAATARKKYTAGRRKAKAGDRLPRQARIDIPAVYHKLFAAHGKQHWWPGDSVFEIMTGAVLTQNTAWTNVAKAITNLKQAKALSPEVIAGAQPKRLAAWLRPSGYFNIKAQRLQAMCRWLIERGGVKKIKKIPTSELRPALLAVHGIGPETADDILLYAFQRPVFVIDAYTRRIFTRLGLIEGSEHYETLRHLFENALATNVTMFNEYHALIVAHGKNICRKRPMCGSCRLADDCAYSAIFMHASN
jgi:endonuclease III related protein